MIVLVIYCQCGDGRLFIDSVQGISIVSRICMWYCLCEGCYLSWQGVDFGDECGWFGMGVFFVVYELLLQFIVFVFQQEQENFVFCSWCIGLFVVKVMFEQLVQFMYVMVVVLVQFFQQGCFIYWCGFLNGKVLNGKVEYGLVLFFWFSWVEFGVMELWVEFGVMLGVVCYYQFFDFGDG